MRCASFPSRVEAGPFDPKRCLTKPGLLVSAGRATSKHQSVCDRSKPGPAVSSAILKKCLQIELHIRRKTLVLSCLRSTYRSQAEDQCPSWGQKCFRFVAVAKAHFDCAPTDAGRCHPAVLHHYAAACLAPHHAAPADWRPAEPALYSCWWN